MDSKPSPWIINSIQNTHDFFIQNSEWQDS